MLRTLKDPLRFASKWWACGLGSAGKARHWCPGAPVNNRVSNQGRRFQSHQSNAHARSGRRTWRSDVVELGALYRFGPVQAVGGQKPGAQLVQRAATAAGPADLRPFEWPVLAHEGGRGQGMTSSFIRQTCSRSARQRPVPKRTIRSASSATTSSSGMETCSVRSKFRGRRR